MIRRLLILAGCFCISGFGTRAQTPVPDFSASVTAGCGPLGVKFTDLSTNSPLYWNWDFGNGQTSALQNPSASYSTPGTYTVTLIARNRSGADAIRKTDYITVYPYPTPVFIANHTIGCAPAAVQFADQSTAGQGSITSWSWDLGDGSSSNQQNPSHSYTQTGYYNISLKVTNSGGCSNTVTQARYLRVVDGVQPNFTWDQTSAACSAPFVLNFVNQTAGPGNLSYSWNLGKWRHPAASSDISPANISYPASGNYDVTLQVSSSLGCSGSLKQTIPLSNNGAVITSPDQACANVPITFTNGSATPPLSSNWDFGDGTNSANLNPSKTYTANGTYTVTLTNTYGACVSTATKPIQVANAPAPVFTADKTAACQAPLTVKFTDNTPPGATQWLWAFGDGQTSTQQNPLHTYTATGFFDVKLTTTNSGGCSNTTTNTQFIKVKAPTLSLSGNSGLGACIVGSPSNTTITPVGAINAVDGVQSYLWEAAGATPATSNVANPVFSYATAGQYSIKLTVTTNGGCSVSSTFNNVINVGTPVAPVITVNPLSLCGLTPATFSDPVTPPITDYRWRWNFGDGVDTLTNQPSATHGYADFGPRTVTLTLFHNGCPQSTSVPVTVNPPIPGFTYSLPDCNDRYSVQFTDTSHLAPPATATASYQWDFGDPASGANNASTLQNPIHTYPTNPSPTPVPYTVTETVTETFTDGTTCTQTFAFTILLGPVIPSIKNDDPNICRNQVFYVSSSSTPLSQIDSYGWQLDGLPAAPVFSPGNVNYSTKFAATGDHVFTLIVKDKFGCFLPPVSKTIHIVGPTAGITLPTPAGGCKNAPLTFTDKSTPFPATTALAAWSWDFGDGTTGNTGPSITHAYTDTGRYSVKLTVSDNSVEQCTDTITAPIVQVAAPQANFAGPDSFYCPGVPLTFVDSSKGYGPLIYSWDFGDGSPLSTIPTHNYPVTGKTEKDYNVTLTVTDIYGCPGTTTKPVRIQAPIPAFDISDTTAICIPLQTKFVAHGQYYESLYWDFGDGSTSTLPNTSHFYNSTGIFNATLFLQGPGGCLESATRKVFLLDPVAASKFNYGPLLSKCDSVPIQFDLAPPGFTNFTLVFGDGAADSSQNATPFHMYRSPGSYTPTLVLVDPTGCIVNVGTAIGPVTVLGSIPFVSLDPHAFCDSSIVTFTDYTITNDGIVSETLNFGDGTPPETHNTGVADFNTDHLYNKPGTFLANLHVVTNSTCAEDYTDTVRVHQTPHPLISEASPLCTGLIQFNGNTTVPQLEPVSWAWDFGNGQTSKDQNPSTDFKPGPYTVRLQLRP